MVDRRPIATVDLGDNGGHVAFYSIDELVRWVEAEREFWSNLTKQQYPSPLSVINDGLHRLQTEAAAARLSQSIEGVINAIREEFITSRRVIHSSSVAAQAMQAISNEHGLLGLRGAVAIALPRSAGAGAGNVVADQAQFIGAVTMANILSGVTKKTAQAAAQSLAMLARHREAQWEQDREAVADYLMSMTQEIAELENNYRDVIVSQNAKHDELVKTAEDARDAAVAAITATDTLFREQMRLKAPADYWQEKHTEHVNRARRLFWILVGSVWLGACAYVWVLKVLWHDLIQLLTGLGPNTAAILVISGLIAIIAALPLWFLRILVRFYLGEQHLATDARERKVMTMRLTLVLASARAAASARAFLVFIPVSLEGATSVAPPPATP